MRVLPSGTIIYPNRGNPPKVPDGYIADPGNPYILRPKAPDCKYREIKQATSKCCNQAHWFYCTHFKKRVVNMTCRSCNEAVS